MVRLKEVAKMDRETREYLNRKLKERRKELAIVKKALKELKEELEYDGKVEWKSIKQAYKVYTMAMTGVLRRTYTL